MSDCSLDDIIDCHKYDCIVPEPSCGIFNDVPFSCMTQLVQNYMTCDEKHPTR